MGTPKVYCDFLVREFAKKQLLAEDTTPLNRYKMCLELLKAELESGGVAARVKSERANRVRARTRG